MEKLLETSDKIFLMKLWGKFEENSQSFWTLHCLDNINMIQIVHQYFNFSSKFLYFFLNPNKRKKLIFSQVFFPSHFFLSIFLFIKFSKTQMEPKGWKEDMLTLVTINLLTLFFIHDFARIWRAKNREKVSFFFVWIEEKIQEFR